MIVGLSVLLRVAPRLHHSDYWDYNISYLTKIQYYASTFTLVSLENLLPGWEKVVRSTG